MVRKIDSDIFIKADSYIPIEIKKSALEWHEIFFNNLPFIITSLIVMGSALVTFCISKKSIKSQQNQSAIDRNAEHENKISEFRHNWLQELRNTSSELSSTLHLCQMHNLANNLSKGYRDSYHKAGYAKDAEMHQRDADKHYERFLSARGEFYKFSSKIRLMFKPQDKKSLQLFELLDKARSSLGNDSTSLDNDIIDEINLELQKLLKVEWEVTKNRKWVKPLIKP